MIEIEFSPIKIKNKDFNKFITFKDIVNKFITENNIKADITVKFDEKNINPDKLKDFLYITKRYKINKFRYD